MNRTIFSIASLTFLVAGCVVTGFILGRSVNPDREAAVVASTDQVASDQASPELKELLLKADTAAGGKKISMATASIDGDIDVLFTLDHESGNLFAWLPGPTGFLGEWSVNVAKAIGLEKGADPDLVLTVGNFNFRGGNSGALRDVPLIIYVGNGDNGQVAGFGFQWNPQMAKTGAFQRGVLVPAYQGSTRQQTIRRQ